MADRDDTEHPVDDARDDDARGDDARDDIVRRHLTRAWQSWAPSPELDARVRARLTSSSAATMGAIGLGASSGAGRPGPWASLQATGKLGPLVGASLVGMGFLSGYLAHSSLSPSASPTPEPPRAAVPAVAGAATSSPEVAPALEAPHIEPREPASEARNVRRAPEAANADTARRRPSRPATPGPVAADTPGPVAADTAAPAASEELSLLQRAERAVRADNAALALALIGELEARYPRSTLLEERSAIELLAHCRAGASDASSRATRFLRQHPQSLYAGRVRELCAAESGDVPPER